MRKLWNKFKSFIGQYDFADAFKDIADDLKKASVALFMLWLLSQAHRLPGVFSALPKVVGVDAAAVQTSAWVSWLLLVAAVVTYVVQFVLRVKAREVKKATSHHEEDNSVSNKGTKDGTPGRSAAVRRNHGSGHHRNQDSSQAKGSKPVTR
jgi:hypothetical protein